MSGGVAGIFNLMFHTDDAYISTECSAQNGSPFDSVGLTSIVGENHHLHHHAFPRLAKRPGVDLAWWLIIKPMAGMRLIQIPKGLDMPREIKNYNLQKKLSTKHHF